MTVTTRPQRAAVIGALLGMVVGAAVGWTLLRPAGAELNTAAHQLVPASYTVHRLVRFSPQPLTALDDGIELRATRRAGATGETPSPSALLKDAEWTVRSKSTAAGRSVAVGARDGMTARVVQQGDDTEVTVESDSTPMRVLAGAAVGGLLGGVLTSSGGRRRTS